MNCLAPLLFRVKKSVEGDTRQFALFTERELLTTFAAAGFRSAGRYAQFFFPMALHRLIGSPRLSFALESCARLTGATGLFGSPVVLTMCRA
jgi:hypothetical protein